MRSFYLTVYLQPSKGTAAQPATTAPPEPAVEALSAIEEKNEDDLTLLEGVENVTIAVEDGYSVASVCDRMSKLTAVQLTFRANVGGTIVF